MTTDPLYTDCPTCGALMSNPCDWSKWTYAQPHPEFHQERTIATALADVPNVVDSMSKQSVDHAFQSALDDLI